MEARCKSVDNVLLFQVLLDSEINHNDGRLVLMVRLASAGDDKRSCCDAINYCSHLLVRISLRQYNMQDDLHISFSDSRLCFVRASVAHLALWLRSDEQQNIVNCFANRLAHISASFRTVTRWSFAPYYSCPIFLFL